MQKKQTMITVKVLVFSALFAALAAILGQLLAIRPVPSAKYTLDKFVLFLSGMFFGPMVGGMVGFVSDFVGGHFFGIGWTAPLCVPAVLYGIFGGVFQKMLVKKFTVPRLAVAYLFPTVIGAVLYQSPMLAFLYNPGTFREALLLNLASRSVQFAIMLVVEVTIIYVLVRSKIFTRAGLWPPVTLKKECDSNDC